MFKSFILLSFLSVFCFAQQSQQQGPPPSTFTIVGSVMAPNRQGVTGTRISLVDENYQIVQSFFVDASGRFSMRGLRVGVYVIKVETSGTPFEEQSQQLELRTMRRFGGDETVTLEFILKYKKTGDTPSRGGPVFAQEVPKAARSEFERGVGQLKGNKQEAAIAAFKRALEKFPDYFQALELLGVEYAKAGQYEAAIETLDHALRLNSRAAASLYAIGVAHLNLHHSSDAIEFLDKAIKLEANNPNTHLMLGLAYGKAGQFEKSEAALKSALRLGGSAAGEAHFYLAGLFNTQGKFPEAIHELEAFLKESKNVKDPSQIKGMIAKLKEKQRQGASHVTTSPVSHPATTEIAATAPTLANDNAEATGGSAESKEIDSAVAAPETNPILRDPVEPLSPEAAELLRQSEMIGGKMHNQLIDYTYQLKKTRRTLNQKGASINAEEQLFEAYPINGEHVLIKLSVNGVPSRSVSDDRKHAMKQLEQAEQKRIDQTSAQGAEEKSLGYITAGVEGIYGGVSGQVSINLNAFLRACEFFAPRKEIIEGREMLALKFRRREGATLSPGHAYISKLVGTIWLDQTDKVIARLEAWPAALATFDLLQSTAPSNDAAIIYQQKRQMDGLWFPTLIRMNAGGRGELFRGLNWDVRFEFDRYQRFNTSSESKIDASDKKP